MLRFFGLVFNCLACLVVFMGKHDEEYDFLEDAFRDEPKASTPVRAGDEGTWLDDAFSEQAPCDAKCRQGESRDYRGDYRGLGFACLALALNL